MINFSDEFLDDIAAEHAYIILAFLNHINRDSGVVELSLLELSAVTGMTFSDMYDYLRELVSIEIIGMWESPGELPKIFVNPYLFELADSETLTSMFSSSKWANPVIDSEIEDD